MKKVALSLIALLAASFVFAEETKVTAGTDLKNPVTASLSASGTGKVGIDLDTGVLGFANEGSASVTLWFLNGTNSKTSDDLIHGQISVADIKVGLDDKSGGNDVTLSIGDITAKVVSGPFYVKLYTNTNPSVGYDFEDGDDNKGTIKDDTFYTYSGIYGSTETEWVVGDFAGYDMLSSKGFEFGMDTGILNIIGGVAAEGDWKSTLAAGEVTESATNDYEAYAKTELIFGEFLKVGVTANAGTYNTDAEGENGETFLIGGAEAYLNLLLLEGWAKLNLDAISNDMFAAAAVQMNVMKFIQAKVTVDALLDAEAETIDSDAAATAYIDFGGLLGATAGLLLTDVLANNDAEDPAPEYTGLGIFAQADLNILGIKTWAKLSANTTLAEEADLNSFVKLGAEITWIPYTTVGAFVNTSDLTGESTGDSFLGEAGVTVKVSY